MSINEFFNRFAKILIEKGICCYIIPKEKGRITIELRKSNFVIDEIEWNFDKEVEPDFFVRFNKEIEAAEKKFNNIVDSLNMRPIQLYEG